MLEELLIPKEFMNVGYVMLVPLLISRMIFMLFGYRFEWFFNFMKFLAYLALANLIWRGTQKIEEVNVFTAFTFIFCCFEAGDNFSRVLEIPFAYFKELIKTLRNNNRKYDI